MCLSFPVYQVYPVYQVHCVKQCIKSWISSIIPIYINILEITEHFMKLFVIEEVVDKYVSFLSQI